MVSYISYYSAIATNVYIKNYQFRLVEYNTISISFQHIKYPIVSSYISLQLNRQQMISRPSNWHL